MLLDEGYTYSSSVMDDVRPHWARAAGVVRHDGPTRPGPEIPLVEVPITFITSDFAYFEFNGYGRPTLPAGLRNPRDVEQIWLDEFAYNADRDPGAFTMLMLHPGDDRLGRADRDAGASARCDAGAGARFVTAEQLADEFRAAAPSSQLSASKYARCRLLQAELAGEWSTSSSARAAKRASPTSGSRPRRHRGRRSR